MKRHIFQPQSKPRLEIKKVFESSPTVDIVLVEGSTLPVYMIKSPSLTQEELEFLSEVKGKILDEIKVDTTANIGERKKIFVNEVLRIMQRRAKDIPLEKQKYLAELIANKTVGYGELEPILADEQVEDVMITGIGAPVYIFHQKYGMCPTNVYYRDEASVRAIIDKAARDAGRRIDLRAPLIDSRMPSGYRLNIIIPPISLSGPILSLRKYKSVPMSVIDLINYGTLSTEATAFLWLLVEGMGVRPGNLLFVGGTGCGKTTTLSAVCAFVPERERVVTIEDAAELRLPHGHWIRLETRLPVEQLDEVTMEMLVKNTLRMRPDRLIIGEGRGAEIATVFSAFSGHTGCMSTIHSNTTAEETLIRLTKPPAAVPEQTISALDAIIMQRRIFLGDRYIRRITEIAEVAGMQDGKIKLNRTHRWDPKTDKTEPVEAPSLALQQISELGGIPQGDIIKELKRREEALKLMVSRKMDVYDVIKTIQLYYTDPEGTLKNLKAGA